jgi:NitT/TauT family transport system substrate-binding protein
MNRLHRRSAAAALVVALAAAGCTTTHQAAAAKPLDKVTYVTAFGSFGRDAYAWVAASKGFFKDQGLQVSIQPGAAGGQNMQKLAAGKAQFVAIDFGTAAYQIASGTDTDLKVISAIHQRTVASIITLTRNHINTPKDLTGKTIGTVNGSILNTMFLGYAKLAGLDPSTIKWQNAEPAQLPTLLAAGRVDAVAQYLMGAPSIEKAAGCTGCSVVLPYAQYLADPYGAVLATTNTLISKDRGLAVRFRTALMQGLDYAVRHPQEAAQILHQTLPTTDIPSATAELETMAPYVTNATPVGAVDPSRIVRAIASLQSIGMYPSGLTPEALVDFGVAPRLGG